MPRNGPSPFNARIVDLRGVALTVLEQTWLINEILISLRTYEHMESCFKIPRATLSRWVTTFVKTGRIVGKRGRPPRVDKDLIDDLQNSITDQEYQMSTVEFKKKVQVLDFFFLKIVINFILFR
jgi:hypothetical protein